MAMSGHGARMRLVSIRRVRSGSERCNRWAGAPHGAWRFLAWQRRGRALCLPLPLRARSPVRVSRLPLVLELQPSQSKGRRGAPDAGVARSAPSLGWFLFPSGTRSLPFDTTARCVAESTRRLAVPHAAAAAASVNCSAASRAYSSLLLSNSACVPIAMMRP